MKARKLLTKAGNVFDRLLDLFAVLAGIVISFIAIAVCVGILTRYLLNYPMSWVIEISEYSLLYMTFLAAAWVLRHGQHVSVDLVYNRFSPRNKSIADLFTSIVAGLVFLIITLYGFKVTKHQFDTKYFTPTFLEAPKFLITLIIPVGSFLLLIQIIRKIYQHLNDLVKGHTPPLEEKEAQGSLRIEP